ncbi:adenylate-forming protein [Asticcacaulis sp. DW145]|uniref:F390 synthetase-related protein n=1 Tax=Asticcacaulis sp. DW145 TaxID=3095608 RepID=UPI00308EA487|nr:adenylate-forming protein [Asticcacaulis sp. DW145]
MRAEAIMAVGQAYMRARWRALTLRNRTSLKAFHQRALHRLTRQASRELSFYTACSGGDFSSFPIIDKTILLENFSRLNRGGLSLESVREALSRGEERLSGRIIGMSTGTSGNRGYYVITERERFTWLGTILAKALPDALWRSHRVALALPALSDLYRAASIGSRIQLRFFDLALGPESWMDELTAFAPDTLVAPPKVLRVLAEQGRLKAPRLFSSAEVLDDIDKRIIEEATGFRLRQIYMATEGLFAVSCPFGTLHLAEDVVHFEFEQSITDSALVSPVVTDFTRREQGMIRYRMNDLFELDHARCPCQSAFQAVARIDGRCDDAFLLADQSGARQLVSPDVLRNAIVRSDPTIDDFRLIQTGPDDIVLQLSDALGATVARKAALEVETMLKRRGLTANLTLRHGIVADYTRKLRRVRRDWRA